MTDLTSKFEALVMSAGIQLGNIQQGGGSATAESGSVFYFISRVISSLTNPSSSLLLSYLVSLVFILLPLISHFPPLISLLDSAPVSIVSIPRPPIRFCTLSMPIP